VTSHEKAPPLRDADPEVARAVGLDEPKKSRTAKVVWWLALLAVGGGVGALGVRQYRAHQAALKPRYVHEQVRRGDLTVVVTATGTLEGQNTVEVGAEVTGRVARVHVDYNSRVKRGDLLAEIDPEELEAANLQARAQVAAADASIQQARATLSEAERTLARAQKQRAEGLVADKDLEAAEASALRAKASLASADASAQMARAPLRSQSSRLAKTKVVSPIDGIVLSRSIEPGQTVTAGFQTPVLFKLAEDLGRMELHVYVDEADVGRTREGQSASFTVDAYPERVFPSKVLSLRNEPHEENNVVTYEAVLEVDNRELLLRPGMTATASIQAETRKNVLELPNAALRFSPPKLPKEVKEVPGEKRVWVDKSGELEPVVVRTGLTDGERVELLSSTLAEGAEVVVDIAEPEKKP
jgi:HlyD family secretion protein